MSADSSMMRRRLRLRGEKETLALEDQPNGVLQVLEKRWTEALSLSWRWWAKS